MQPSRPGQPRIRVRRHPAEAGQATGVRRRIITEYTRAELIALVKWIESDGLLRTEDELIRLAMDELGFQKRGSRIVTALEGAIRTARRTR